VELELQAEVDKFVFSALDTESTDKRSLKKLLRRLFVDVSYADDLSAELEARYRKANACARAYCLWLSDNFELRPDNRRLRAELARFYRAHGQTKFSRIQSRRRISPCEYIRLQ